jgi:uncharacterized protein (TIGR00730 family)
MGALAKELVKLSGPDSVTGVIPKALMEYEQGGSSNTSPSDSNNSSGPETPVVVPDPNTWGRTIVVPTMHARKSLMASYVISGSSPGSGFVALSGGYGTLEELMEVVTWNQLGIHHKPIVLYNVEGYWDGLLAWVRKAVEQIFVSEPNSNIILEGKDAEGVIKGLREYVNSEGKMRLKWGEVEGGK